MRLLNNIDLILQHLEFKVWEHLNLKVGTSTLKIYIYIYIYIIRMVLFLLLRSKMPTIGIKYLWYLLLRSLFGVC